MGCSSAAGLVLCMVVLFAAGDVEDSSSSSLSSSSSSSSSSCAPVREALTQMSGEPFPSELGSCALVGGSSILEGSGHGLDIEAHDTVIRINRLPHPRHYGDVGSRTDVYFANTLSKFDGLGAKLEWENGVKPQTRFCRHDAASCRDNVTASLPATIVFEGAPFDDFWRLPSDQRRTPPSGPQAIKAAKASILAFLHRRRTLKFQDKKIPFPEAHPVARQSHALHFFEHNLPIVPYSFNQRVDKRINDRVAEWGYSSKPSGGLKAFLTFANLCDSVTLFGYGGAKTSLDGHAEVGHSFQTEESFYKNLQNLQIEENGDSSANNIRHWFPTNFRDFLGFEPYFDRFADRIACLARRQKIRIVQ